MRGLGIGIFAQPQSQAGGTVYTDPLSLSGIQFLMDADSLAGFTIANTNEVAAYTERSPNGFADTIPSGRPLRVLNAVDGRAAIEMNQGRSANFSDILPLGAANWTAFCVFAYTNRAGQGQLGPFWRGDTFSNDGTWEMNVDGSNVTLHTRIGGERRGVAAPLGGGAFAFVEWEIVRSVRQSVGVNRGTRADTALPPDAASYAGAGDFQWGWPLAPDYFQGQIAHFALFNRILTAAERNGVTNWYKQRYPSLGYALV